MGQRPWEAGGDRSAFRHGKYLEVRLREAGKQNKEKILGEERQ